MAVVAKHTSVAVLLFCVCVVCLSERTLFRKKKKEKEDWNVSLSSMALGCFLPTTPNSS